MPRWQSMSKEGLKNGYQISHYVSNDSSLPDFIHMPQGQRRLIFQTYDCNLYYCTLIGKLKTQKKHLLSYSQLSLWKQFQRVKRSTLLVFFFLSGIQIKYFWDLVWGSTIWSGTSYNNIGCRTRPFVPGNLIVRLPYTCLTSSVHYNSFDDFSPS